MTDTPTPQPTHKRTEFTTASDLYAAQTRFGILMDRFEEWLAKLLGVEYVPGERITLDDYDHSFELKEVDSPTFRWPDDKLQPIWDAGFDKFWICHKNGWETYYAKGGISARTDKRARNEA